MAKIKNNTFNEENAIFRKPTGRKVVCVPNCAIDELSLAAGGFYLTLLNEIQNHNATFTTKEELISKMLEYTPRETKRSAEKAWNELVEKGYILHTKDEVGENVEITYGPYGRIGEQ